ncbi:LpxI family protein [Elusimicrobiota bacterium]
MVKKIGLIAGNGRFPFLVAEEIKKRGEQCITVAIKEETDPALENIADKIIWVSLGQFQKLIDTFHSENISTALMVGQVKHAQLFAGLKFDLRTVKLLASLKNKKTDTVLGAFVKELEKEGIKLLPSHEYLKHLLPKPGLICGKKLNRQEKADVEFGHRIAKSIAGLDIGQTIAVKDKVVLAVESIEGTNECIKRASKYAGENVIVIKVVKPDQDWRFDLPVIGPDTIIILSENKARAMVVDAGATLMIEKEKMLDMAKKSSITILAV